VRGQEKQEEVGGRKLRQDIHILRHDIIL